MYNYELVGRQKWQGNGGLQEVVTKLGSRRRAEVNEREVK